jgi:HD-GYP domain-containing protein (c-di-GMP phosphodiesterase class II)
MLRDTRPPSSRFAQTNTSSRALKKNAGYEHIRIPETREPGIFLLEQEYQEAYLDLARSKSGILPRPGDEGISRSKPLPVTGTRTVGTGKEASAVGWEKNPALSLSVKKSSLKEEMPHARRAYDHAVACVRDLMASAAQGNLPGGAAHEAVQGLVDSLERNIDALLCLPRIRQRDAYMYTHCVNVSVLLAAYALVSGQDRREVITYALAGLFHDIGKALLPVSLLNARRTLSITEQTLIMRHPMLGCELLITSPELHSEMIIMAALEHHERYDGSGYPKGLAGDAISELGHLAAIADNYDALSSRRPYKGATLPHKTLGVLYQLRQKHFHPEIVENFVRMVGIYPVGSVVELKDGYRGVVTASNYDNPMLPVVTLALDPKGAPVPAHVRDLAKEPVSGIARCVPTELSGLDHPCRTLGIVL